MIICYRLNTYSDYCVECSIIRVMQMYTPFFIHLQCWICPLLNIRMAPQWLFHGSLVCSLCLCISQFLPEVATTCTRPAQIARIFDQYEDCWNSRCTCRPSSLSFVLSISDRTNHWSVVESTWTISSVVKSSWAIKNCFLSTISWWLKMIASWSAEQLAEGCAGGWRNRGKNSPLIALCKGFGARFRGSRQCSRIRWISRSLKVKVAEG